MLYITEALKHTAMLGLQPGRTRKDIHNLPRLMMAPKKNILFMLYIPEGLKHAAMLGLHPGRTRIITLIMCA